MNLKTQYNKSQSDLSLINRLVAKSLEKRQSTFSKNIDPNLNPNISRMTFEHSLNNTIVIKAVMSEKNLSNPDINLQSSPAKNKISDLRLMMKSKLTNEEIDQKLNDLRNEWERDI